MHTAGVDFLTAKIHQVEWGVTVFGAGLSGAVGLEVSTRSRFTAAHGETKVIFLPVSFQVESGFITKRGKRISAAHRADMHTVTSSALGSLLLDPGAVPPLGERVQSYSLAGDASGALATYEYRYQRKAAHKVEHGREGFRS